MALSQKARETVEQRLVAGGWVLQNGDAADPGAATGVVVRKYPLAVSTVHGQADYVAYINNVLYACILDFGHATDPDTEPLAAVSLEDLVMDDDDLAPLNRERTASWDPSIENENSRRLINYFVKSDPEIELFEIYCEGLFSQEKTRRLCWDFHSPASLAAHQNHQPMPWGDVAEALEKGTLPPGIYWALAHLSPPDGKLLWPGQAAALTYLENCVMAGTRRACLSMPHGAGVTYMLAAWSYRLASAGNALRILHVCKSVQTAYLASQSFEDFGTNLEAHRDSVLDLDMNFEQKPERHSEGTHVRATVWQDGLPDPRAQVIFCTADALAETPNIPWDAFNLILCDDPLPEQLDRLIRVLKPIDCEQYLVASGPTGELAIEYWGNHAFIYTTDQVILDGALVPTRLFCLSAFRQGGDVAVHADFASCGEREYQPESHPAGDEIATPEFAPACQMKDSNNEDLPRLKPGTDEVDFAILQAFREHLFTELFPDRMECPKTIIFARDVDHSRAIAGLVTEVFRREVGFCVGAGYETGDSPICDATFKTGVEADQPLYESAMADRRVEREIQCFSTSVLPRVIVCPVDSPLIHQHLGAAEITVLLWPVDSRAQLASMISRGSFNLRKNLLHRISPDVPTQCGKGDHVLVDAAGMADEIFNGPAAPMDLLPRHSLGHILQEIAFGKTEDSLLRSLAARLLTLDSRLFPDEKQQITKLASGATPHTLALRLLQSVDPEKHRDYAIRHRLNTDSDRTMQQARALLVQQATRNLTASVELRNELAKLHKTAISRKSRPDSFYGADTQPPMSVVPEDQAPVAEP